MDFRPEQQARPPQHQDGQPGREDAMQPRPVFIRENYRGSGRLENRIALITGGDSGIGRAVAVHCAREGAHVAIAYLDEHRDAEETKRLVEAEGRNTALPRACRRCNRGSVCYEVVNRTAQEYGGLDIW